jgi:hypothetical protein
MKRFQVQTKGRDVIWHDVIGKAFKDATAEQRAILLNCLVNFAGVTNPNPASLANSIQPYLNDNVIELMREIVRSRDEI